MPFYDNLGNFLLKMILDIFHKIKVSLHILDQRLDQLIFVCTLNEQKQITFQGIESYFQI